MRQGIRRLARTIVRRTEDDRRVNWSGVYAAAAEVPVSGEGFAGDTWIRTTREQTRSVLDDHHSRGEHDIAMLATVVALMPETPRILDFGGGMGIGYLHLRRALGERTLDYCVVEGERVCSEGRALLGAHPGVRFETALPASATFDVVYARSSLQYIADPPALLGSLVAYRPRYVLLADVPAGDIPDFWTAQLTVQGSQIPYHFFNVGELVAAMASLGFSLLVRGAGTKRLAVESLPAPYRVPHTSHLLFGR